MASPAIEYRGLLEGHDGWVTNIATPWAPADSGSSANRIIASGSRDNKVILWSVNPESFAVNNGRAGTAVRSLCKHTAPVSDVVLSSKGEYLVSTSWDKTMRLWDVNYGTSFRNFVGHTREVTGGALSMDSRQIVSCSYDKTVRLWNTLAEQKFVLTENQHSDWISSVRFSPERSRTLVVSCGWDKLVKLWNLNKCKIDADLAGHTGPVKAIAISPDGSLCASGGADGQVMLWDVVEDAHLYSLEAQSPVHSLCYSPCNYWLCAATDTGIKIWDLERKRPISDVRMVPSYAPGEIDFAEYRRAKNRDPITLHTLEQRQNPPKHLPWCTSLAWSPEGEYLYAGSSNGKIYVFGLHHDRS